MQMKEVIDNLEARIADPDHNAVSGKLTNEILQHAGASSPFKLSGNEFNMAAEAFYRKNLRKQHLAEALSVTADDCVKLEKAAAADDALAKAISQALNGKQVCEFLSGIREDVLNENLNTGRLTSLICLLILLTCREMAEEERYN